MVSSLQNALIMVAYQDAKSAVKKIMKRLNIYKIYIDLKAKKLLIFLF